MSVEVCVQGQGDVRFRGAEKKAGSPGGNETREDGFRSEEMMDRREKLPLR